LANYICRRAETLIDVDAFVEIIGHIEACHYFMHTRLGRYRRHVNPKSGGKREEAILSDGTWILQKFHFIVFPSEIGDIRKSPIIVVPL
jgi:hypothetical protein